MSAGSTFTAAMVQMRTGLLPEPSLEQGTRLIREAAAQGADYVQTPEVSNMMQLNRKALFEHLASEEDDKSLKAYRALAAELKIHLHIGSLALRFSPERAVNRSFLIGPDGNVLASYDKIHMFDIDLPGGEMLEQCLAVQLHHVAHLGGEHVIGALRCSLADQFRALLKAGLGQQSGAHLHHGGRKGGASAHEEAFSPASMASSLPARSSA